MSEEKKVIAFSKWHDPWGLDEEESKDDGYDANDSYEDSMEYEDKYSSQKKQPKPVKSLLTPMGPIPLNEHSSPSKNWNLWVGHSNFRFTKRVVEIIAKVDGVETLDVFTPYRIRIGIAKMFQPGKVMGRITESINKELNKSTA